jgi:hypothetical protein
VAFIPFSNASRRVREQGILHAPPFSGHALPRTGEAGGVRVERDSTLTALLHVKVLVSLDPILAPPCREQL